MHGRDVCVCVVAAVVAMGSVEVVLPNGKRRRPLEVVEEIASGHVCATVQHSAEVVHDVVHAAPLWVFARVRERVRHRKKER